MQQDNVVSRLTEALAPEAEAHGFELVAIEQAGGRGVPVVRVLLDREGGINVDDLSAANEWISAVLDAENPFSRPYTLEVSSPGIDRPLVRKADFERFAGQTVTVWSKNDERRSTRTGVLAGLDGDDILLDFDNERHAIPYDSVQKARLKGALDFGKGREQSS
ncbi:MAG: ribosome maturation factor RimP [Coriobacteriia bacterium]|nr:ribosome maturation factor RimP [Coriobacteriia bacterium]